MQLEDDLKGQAPGRTSKGSHRKHTHRRVTPKKDVKVVFLKSKPHNFAIDLKAVSVSTAAISRKNQRLIVALLPSRSAHTIRRSTLLNIETS